MMEAVQTSEKSVNSYRSTRRYNPEDSHLRRARSFCIKNNYWQLERVILLPNCMEQSTSESDSRSTNQKISHPL
jgi:hypothetical protein